MASAMLALFLIMAAGAANSLSPKEAREAIATIPGFEFNPKMVRIKDIEPGSGGAIVEAQFDSTFRLDKRDNRWEVVEVRLGDSRWEDMELIVTAVRNEKIKRSRDQLLSFGAAITSYQREYGYYPRARDIVELTDILVPKYMNSVIRSDLWLNNYQYSTNGNGYRLQSLGPDGKANTGDEITLENGEFK